MFSTITQEALRAITSALQIPTVVILLLLIAATVFLLGSLIAEFFSERRHMRVAIPQLIDRMQGLSKRQLGQLIAQSGLLKRQKKALQGLITREHLPEGERDALARQLIFEEQSHYDRIKRVTDLIAKIGPMFGLMGTLIPLGPGLIALGQGDTQTLSSSLLIAFDTTVAGLVTSAISYIISNVRARWYEGYMVALETVMECVLEEQNKRSAAK